MQKNDLIIFNCCIHRILNFEGAKILVIDCEKRTMPIWVSDSLLYNCKECTIEELQKQSGVTISNIEQLSMRAQKKMYERYSLIAPILALIDSENERSYMINRIAQRSGVSKQTIRKYLCLFLAYQDITVLAPKETSHAKPLTDDEKKYRWALNKFYYTRHKNSLKTAYILMLKERYTHDDGLLYEHYPKFHQFRYYYDKHKSLQTYYISRDGLSSYQRNNRPLLGDGVQEFAPNIGIGLIDSTICDIHLVNNEGKLLGRPILTVCIDAYSSLCMGYSLLLEGGVFSLSELMQNVIKDKVEHCKKFGVDISYSDWDSNSLPSTIVTDKGKEFVGRTFEQLTELGVKIINLPPYRAELKGTVEKFFDLIQNSYKPYLHDKGVIEPDFAERGTKDYRKNASLTMVDFEKILLRCIIYYNTQRIIENFPYTNKMIECGVKPYANSIWQWGKQQLGASLIPVDSKLLALTLFPRTNGKFTRKGLQVNRLNYHCIGYTERYLRGDKCVVAYNPKDVSYIWLVENGTYIRFELIESIYNNMSIEEVKNLQDKQKELISQELHNNTQARILLATHIQTISNKQSVKADVSSVRETRRKEITKNKGGYHD